MNKEEVIKIIDSLGFHYNVTVKHFPHNGFSAAYYNDTIIASADMYRIHEPYGDDDAEWERYEELFGEYRDQVVSDLERLCKEYFDRK